MSIGIDFVLRASSAQFTKALASANNSVKDLKKGLKDFDVGNGFKQALGVGGVIAGFRAAITNAQELRDEAEKMGKTLDDGTRSVAAYGDALDDMWKGTKNVATQTLSFFTRAGEGWGMLINRLRGVTAEQEKIAEGAARGAREQEAAADKLYNSQLDKSKKLDGELKDQRERAATAGMSTEEKRNKLLEDREKLYSEIDQMQEYSETGSAGDAGKAANAARKEKQVAANKLTEQIGLLGNDLVKDQEKKDSDARRELKSAQEDDFKREQEVRDQFAPSVEQLAKMDVGGFAKADDPRLRARQILEKEKFAAEAGGRGDITGAMKLGGEARNMREALSNISGKGTALSAENATDAFKTALETTNKELAELKTVVAGKFKAEK